MTYPFDRIEKATDRLRRADEKLTGAMRWVVFESRGVGSDDHEVWNQEPAVARSTNAAPPKVEQQYRKSDSRRKIGRWLLWIAVVIAVGAAAVWVTLRLAAIFGG